LSFNNGLHQGNYFPNGLPVGYKCKEKECMGLAHHDFEKAAGKMWYAIGSTLNEKNVIRHKTSCKNKDVH
jgi:hypothetical protein